MGEAKRRGSFEDRKQQAIAREKHARAVRNVQRFVGMTPEQQQAYLESVELQRQAKNVTQAIGAIRVPSVLIEEPK